MKSTLISLLALGLGTASAASSTVNLNINGRQVTAPVTTMNGKQVVQLPLDVLKSAGAVIVGGSKPVDAILGCANETLFNGVWRVKVGAPGKNSSGVPAVKVTLTNGTSATRQPRGEFTTDGGGDLGMTFQDAAGKTSKASWSDLVDTDVIAGASVIMDVTPYEPQSVKVPTKLIIQVRKDTDKSLTYLKNASFRVDLTCKK